MVVNSRLNITIVAVVAAATIIKTIIGITIIVIVIIVISAIVIHWKRNVLLGTPRAFWPARPRPSSSG